MRLFGGFRSRERDNATDIARIGPILDAVRAAGRAAEAELGGLKARLADVGARAAFLVGPDLESEALADPANKTRLDEMESEMKRGGMRRRYLERQVRILGEVAGVLSAVTGPAHGSAAAGRR